LLRAFKVGEHGRPSIGDGAPAIFDLYMSARLRPTTSDIPFSLISPSIDSESYRQ
jgi:hypothetical protein